MFANNFSGCTTFFEFKHSGFDSRFGFDLGLYMFKKLTRAVKEVAPFDDVFWSQYQESYTGKDYGIQSSEILSYNVKKYSGNSSAVTLLTKYFETMNLPIPSILQIIALLKSPITNGDITRTFHLIRFYQLSSEGYFITNSPLDKFGQRTRFIGAENWGNVMCYLDSLLFAMFATLESFEPILFISNYHNHKPNGHLISRLSSLLRVYINLLRSGNLITTDLTMQLCITMASLGFTQAVSHKQQDAADLFEFLTETLSMPLLTFKVDIKHGGKFNKNDDEKISKERILFVSIPDDDEDTYTPLYSVQEDHPEKTEERSHSYDGASSVGDLNIQDPAELNYEVKSGISSKSDYGHHSGVPATSTSEYDSKSRIPEPQDDILLEECLEHYFHNSIRVKRELERRATLESLRKSTNPDLGNVTFNETTIELTESDKKSSQPIPKISATETIRTRSSTLSLWSNDNSSTNPREVSLPAWMFLTLLPFYTDINDVDGTATNSKEFVNRRPVLPICLKRYFFDTSSVKANRSRRRVIIPPIINLPDFVADDADESTDLFKLILESAVFHRGVSIDLGHYVSATRKNYSKTNLTIQESLNESWYLFDDMNYKNRVVKKTFSEIFDKEWPYMLFYRLVANDQDSSFIRPEGFKTKYWGEEELTTVLSTETLQMVSNLPVLPIMSIVEKGQTISAAPIDVLPDKPGFVDIRNKHFWYVPDKDQNYCREIGDSGYEGSLKSNGTIKRQFRRNSQWGSTGNNARSARSSELTKTLLEIPTLETKSSAKSEEKITEQVSKESEKTGHHHHHKLRKSKKREKHKREKCLIV